MKKIVYILEINSNGCNYKLWLNGIRSDIQMSNMPIVYDLPVNHCLIKGLNQVKIELLPLAGNSELLDSSYVKIKVGRGELIDGQVPTRTIVKSIESPNLRELREANPENPIPSYTVNDSFTTQTDFENPLFEELIPLNTSIQELQKVYYELHNLLLSGDTAALLQRMKFKINVYANSYYNSIEEEIQNQREYLTTVIGKQLHDMNFENYNLSYFLDKKLVCIEDDEGGRSGNILDR